jgi:hypothetical protein
MRELRLMARGRWDMQARLMALIANCNAKNPDYRPSDFNPLERSTREKLSPKRSVKRLIAFFGAKEEPHG